MTFRTVLITGLMAGLTAPLALADEWESDRAADRYWRGRVDVDVDEDNDYDVDVYGDRYYRAADDDDLYRKRDGLYVDVDDDFDVDVDDDFDIDVDDDDGWRFSIRGDWGRGYESDRWTRYGYRYRSDPFDRWERGYTRRGYGTWGDADNDRRDYTRQRRAPGDRDELIPDRGVGQYYGDTTPRERYYNRSSEYFSRSVRPPAGRYGAPTRRGTAYRGDDYGQRSTRRSGQRSDVEIERRYDVDDDGRTYTYEYEYDLDD